MQINFGMLYSFMIINEFGFWEIVSQNTGLAYFDLNSYSTGPIYWLVPNEIAWLPVLEKKVWTYFQAMHEVPFANGALNREYIFKFRHNETMKCLWTASSYIFVIQNFLDHDK